MAQLIETLKSFGLDKVADTITEVKNTVQQNTQAIANQSIQISKLTADINNIEKKTKAAIDVTRDGALRNAVINTQKIENQEQRDRSRSIKLVGYAADPKLKPESLGPLVFKDVLKPIIAKFDSNVRDWTDYIDMVHFNPGQKKTIQIAFISRIVRDGILRNKRVTISELPSPLNEVVIHADISQTNLAAVRKLRAHPHIKSAWFDGRFCYKTVDDPQTIRRIKSIDDPLILNSPQVDDTASNTWTQAEPHLLELLRQRRLAVTNLSNHSSPSDDNAANMDSGQNQ